MNELLILITMVTSIVFVFTMWKLGKERLYSAIVVFLILVATVGSKIIPVLGHYTNTGNIFYASVFLATYFLIERYGKEEGIRSIWVGAICVVSFSILVQLAVALNGAPYTDSINQAFKEAFSPVPRLAFASLLAYVISQSVNVYFYIYLKQKLAGKNLWYRANLSNALAQALDSIIFFSFAFFDTVPSSNIWDIIITGLILKIIFMMIAAPVLYFNRIEERDGGGYSSITIM